MPKATPTATPAATSKPGLRVRSCSPMGTFRRGGIAFDHQPSTIALDTLTEAQIKRIETEPMLVVEKVEIPIEAAAEPAADT